MVIDPGMHTATPLLAMMADKGLTLDKIVLTHGHIDHTRDAGELAKRCGVDVYIHESDEFMLSAGEGVNEQTRMLFDADAMVPIPAPKYLRHGDLIDIAGIDFEIRHAPGHSPGSVLLVSTAAQLCIAGDVLFRGSIGRTDLPVSSHSDMLTSLQEQVLTLPDEMGVLPGHGPDTTIRAERVQNPFLQQLRA